MSMGTDSPRVKAIEFRHGQPKGRVRSKAITNVGRDKSLVDDLNMERGTVSVRVAFVLRSAEVQPLF